MKAKNQIDEVRECIVETIQYYDFFGAPVTFDMLWQTLPIRMSPRALRSELHILSQLGQIEHYNNKENDLYALGGHGTLLKKSLKRKAHTSKKLLKTKWIIRAISLFPLCRLIGISGSCSMDNAQPSDDIDIFIIASGQSMWQMRLIAIVIALLTGVHRSRNTRHTMDKLCFNMFMEVDSLLIPSVKQNLYTAHELVQLKVVIDKGNTYKRLLFANRWIKDYFPNIKIHRPLDLHKSINPYTGKGMGIIVYPLLKLARFCSCIAEVLAKKLQLSIMKPHITSELITDGQLWFFPRDFQQRLKRKGFDLIKKH